jgi:hypothetical protein
VYGAIAVQFVAVLVPGKSWADFAGFAVIAAIVFVLAWAVAREKSKYALWLLLFIFVVDVLDTVTQFWGEGPSWLQHAIVLDHPATRLGMTLDVVTNLFEVAAVYFFGAVRAASQS